MIGERYAGIGQAGAVRARPTRRSLRARLAAKPAISGRERIAQTLGDSVLVQLMLAMALVAFAALLYLFQASHVSVLEMNISDLQSQQVQLRMDNAALRSTATTLQSLQRVDAAATGRLHMTRPDLSTTIWIRPVVPRLSSIRAVNADTVEAQRQSQPLAWMERALAAAKSSL